VPKTFLPVLLKSRLRQKETPRGRGMAGGGDATDITKELGFAKKAKGEIRVHQ